MSQGSDWSVKKENMLHYDEAAGIYDAQYAEEQKRKYEVVLSKIHVSEDDLVLDLGCGTGMFEAEKLGCCVGVDISWKLLSVANEKRGGERASFVRADAGSLPFAAGVFDKVFSFTVLQNVPDPEKAIKEMLRVARKGSEIGLSVLRKSFTAASFLRLLAESGLSLVELVDEEALKDYVAVCRAV